MKPTSPVSPGKSTVADFEEVRLAMIQGALDLWQHTMASKLAHRMGRQQILAPFLDALELLGVEMPQDVEALYQAEEEDLVLYISDNMPLRLQECFEDVIPEIQQAGQSLGQLRRRLEADDADGVVKAVEAMDFRCCVPTLRRAVEHAAQEASRLQRCQDSWKATTEARIYRLENAKEEAEKATREFLAVDAKLSTFRSKVSERSQACLMGLSMNSEKATVSSCFAFWRGATEEGKVQQELRDMYEAQVADMQRQVLDYQAHRLKSVRHALTRNVAESGATMLRTLWQCWVADTAQCRQRSDCQRRLDQARAKLTVAKQSRAASCRKIVSHMLLDSEVAPLVMCLQAWTQFMQEEVKEKAAEAKVQTIERRLKELMHLKKHGLMHVLGALLDDQAEELVVEIFQTWLQHSQEEKRTREMDDAMGHFTDKLAMLKSRQKKAALEVRSRVTLEADLNLLEKFLNHWKITAKSERLEQFFRRKLDSKRKQVSGVQTLFQTFAQQIEANLDEEDDEEIAPERRRKKHHRQGTGEQSMTRGGNSMSLPDIHRKPS